MRINLLVGLLLLTVTATPQQLIANNKSFDAVYRNYSFKVDTLIESGAFCEIESALVTVWAPGDSIYLKKMEENKTIRIDDFGVRFIKGYRRDEVDYLQFSIRNGSEAVDEPEGKITVTDKGYVWGLGNYRFRVDHLVYGSMGCVVKKVVLEIINPDDVKTERTLFVGNTIYFEGMEIEVLDAYQSPDVSYAEIVISDVMGCVETDNGDNTLQKGICKDSTGSYTDLCLGDMIVEYSCVNSMCKITTVECGKGKCIEGACVGSETTTTATTTTFPTTSTESTTTSTTTTSTTTTTSAEPTTFSTTTSTSTTTTIEEDKPLLNLSPEYAMVFMVFILLILGYQYISRRKHNKGT